METNTTERKLSKKAQKEQDRAEAIDRLRGMIKPGDKVYTILRHVSKSGMSRDISLLIDANCGTGERALYNITYLAARALDDRLIESGGSHAIRIGGCGMDMGFNLVYCLGRKLFPEGFKPSDAGKKYGRNGTNPNEIDTDGGYALNQQWV